MVKRPLVLLVFLVLVGCRSPKGPEVGMDEISVPHGFRPTLNWIDKSPSDYERYLGMFREGYWDCIAKFTEDINYVPTESDYDANGWISEIVGYRDGYAAAERDVQRNVSRFGKARTAEYLKSITDL